MNRAFGFCACMTACSLAFAQHADDNAVRAAVDAFGSTIGSETVGLYGPDYVRGFSPQSAGNLRIEGMYFDQQGALSERVLDGLTVRVGPSAHQYPFPAPTGIIDYDLRRRADRNTLTPSVRFGPFGSMMAQADGHLAVPLANLYIPGGIAYGIQADIPNHTERAFSVGVEPNWRPSDRLSIRLFLDYQRFLDSRTQPRVYSDELFPPPLVSPKFFGQTWTDSAIRFSTVGGTLRWHIDTHWTLMSGLFYSSNFSSPQFVDQFVNTTRLGLAQHQVIGYPDQSQASSSGEIRLRWHRQSGAWYHSLIGMIRARDVLTRYAGDDLRELGQADIRNVLPVLKPAFSFTARTRDHSQLIAAGLAYEGNWLHHGEWSGGLQKESYSKRVDEPSTPGVVGSDRPWRAYANASIALTGHLSLYAGYTQGLEDSGLAPTNATNRGAVLPAVQTQQRDIGIRYSPRPSLSLILGAFDVRKPYFNLDATNLYIVLGEQRHRGLEFSLTGDLSQNLHVVLGASISPPQVRRAPELRASIGSLAVGQPNRVAEADFDYELRDIKGLSVVAHLSHYGKRAANLDNSIVLPSHSYVGLGARYRFRLLGGEALVKFGADNVTDVRGWDVDEGGGYGPLSGRSYSLSLTVDR